jgi:hypothetical protein
MNRTQHWSGRIAIAVTSAAILGLVAHASPEPANTDAVPPQIAASLNAICRIGDQGRPDPAWLRESFENDHCSAPREPPALDGTKASRDQLMAGLAAARQFAASAERYQECISAYLTQRMQEAQRTGTPVKAAVLTIETHRIVASAASKKRVSDRIAMAVDDFNAEGSECPDY